jgi:adenosylmethionine-8-amino-7-oxononanoate aminotransferase
VIAEPVQNGAGAICAPDGYWQELRLICDKYDVLLHADEVINSFGRLGTWFGADYVGVVPDMISFAKGATSGYAPVGGLLIRTPLVEGLMESDGGSFTHGATWGGHPVAMAAIIANINAMREEKVIENVSENEKYFRSKLDDLAAAHDVVMDIRGAGYFYAIAVGQSRADERELTDSQVAEYVSSVLPELITEAGLLIRADDRGGLTLMLSPPLIAGQAELDELVEGVSLVLDGMAQRHTV